MKKVIGIIVGVIAVIAILLGIAAATGNLKVNTEFKVTTNITAKKPSNTAINKLFETYLTKINAGADEDIYKNVLVKEFQNQYTLNQIKQMHDYVRGLGAVKNTNLDKAKYDTSKEGDIDVFEVSTVVDFENAPQLVKLKTIYQDNELKILSFSFSNKTE